ncbi:DUF2004 domain-containing protein [Hellea balneolensis]|uniref:DUF2004 domain-containing protein n=1 Tax=Hellea balneolensis TaxID=287478 RepID=UPI00040C93B0|nr:DUF2004 domain-containing protein [Hellea balneolensis]
MPTDTKETLALAKIKACFGKPEGEFSSTLFVSHHLEELSKENWLALLSIKEPTPQQILDCLILKDKWDSADDGLVDTYDFTLPENLTDYLLSVRFSEDGNIKSISLES